MRFRVSGLGFRVFGLEELAVMVSGLLKRSYLSGFSGLKFINPKPAEP